MSVVGFAVGVTVTSVDTAPSPWEIDDPDFCDREEPLGGWLPARRSAAETAELLAQIVVAEAKLAALRAELVMDLAAARPAPDGRSPGGEQAGQVGPPGVSEFLPDELALIQNCSRTAAVTQLEHAEILTTRLPATHAELSLGRLDWARARAMAAEVAATGRDTDPAAIAGMETAVLPRAAELGARKLREAVRAELLARDAAAADRRREQRRRGADVTVRPVGDGMSEFRALLPHPEARACRDAADRHARAAKEAGDTRPIGMLRAGAAADLMLRPWDDTRPPVTAHLTVVAPLTALTPASFLAAGAPLPAALTHAPAPVGEVDGEPITAAHLRELLAQLDAVGPSRSPTPPARCWPSSAAQNSSGWPAAAAPTTPPRSAPAPCRPGRARSTATAPHPPSSGSCGSATAPAGTPAAPSGPAGPTSTTSSRTPTAARPRATTCAASAAATTGSRPSPPAGPTPSTTTAYSP
ncbi:DUF222 domain-containing protein [Blastococcus montanus]|uniref:DUF222 domain-containing protein n=1 Tax=Blastococcus montanus TaxID=3144973 RepID=UPI003208C238